jgi:CRP/FNR family transcriptional regulator
MCVPAGLDAAEIERMEDLVHARRRIKQGETLYQAGSPFRSLYAVRTGWFKSCVTSPDGRSQVTGFQMAGELIGIDGIDENHHTIDVVALEDSEVCVIPYQRLEELCARMPALQRQIYRAMSREIVHDHDVMMLLGSMRAEERVAGFLLNLSGRFLARGYAASQFQLRMSREQIGSYLGLKLETVSRVFSKFHEDGLLSVQKRLIRILDQDGLKKVLHHGLS